MKRLCSHLIKLWSICHMHNQTLPLSQMEVLSREKEWRFPSPPHPRPSKAQSTNWDDFLRNANTMTNSSSYCRDWALEWSRRGSLIPSAGKMTPVKRGGSRTSTGYDFSYFQFWWWGFLWCPKPHLAKTLQLRKRWEASHLPQRVNFGYGNFSVMTNITWTGNSRHLVWGRDTD